MNKKEHNDLKLCPLPLCRSRDIRMEIVEDKHVIFCADCSLSLSSVGQFPIVLWNQRTFDNDLFDAQKREIERLVQDNRQLREEVEELRTEVQMANQQIRTLAAAAFTGVDGGQNT